jgi:sugar lactone lactonase YvrE
MNSHIRRVRPLLAAVTALCLWHVPGAGAATVRDAYTTPGTYSLTIPAYATNVNVIANGAGGTDGSFSGGNGSAGGTGGAGSEVNADIPIVDGSFISPGDTLKIAVGARGAGGSGAGGNEVGGGGGNGGQASSITDQTSQGTLLAIAGGGGGGGGGGGAFAGYNGGAGGAGQFTNGNGGSGAGAGGGGGGAFTTNLNCADPNGGGSASGAGGGTDAGGGGGGGDGYCAGGAGSSGGFGGGGGGGGASGNSYFSGTGNGTISVQSVSGDGSVILTFTTASAAPQITSAASDATPSGAGVVNYQVTSSGNPVPTYSLAGAPSWLTIDPASGLLSGKIPAGTVARYSFIISADNGTAPAATQQFTLNVIAPKLIPTAPGTLHGNVTNPFSFALQATGGIPPYSWSLTSGMLPAGLKLAANGIISGTPTATATKTVTVTLRDHAIPAAETATESLTIAIAPRTLTITTASLARGMVGSAYSAPLQASMGAGALHWSVSSGALPAGLMLNAATGKVTGTPTAAGTSSFTVKVTDSTTPTAMVAIHSYTLTVNPAVQAAVYTSQGGYSGVLSFPLGASGNVAPASAITGAAAGLNSTTAITFDSTGRLFVANAGSPSIAEYAYGTTGNVPSTTTITGSATGLDYPDGLSVGPNGDLYVSDYTSGTITVYAPGASGNATPVATIGGSKTGLLGPAGLTFDGAGHLWVTNAANNSLTEYAAAANGNVAPLATIAGSETGLSGPQGVVLDNAGNLLVANTYASSLIEFAPSANGNVAPMRTISGPGTGLSFPIGIDVDAAGNIYVANEFAGLTEYSPSASGAAIPIAAITGPSTGLSAPSGLAVAPPLAVRTTRLRPARVDHRYAARLRALLGTTPYTWRIMSGRLPRRIHLRRDGMLVGRPRHRGTFHLLVEVRDHSHKRMTATERLTLIVRGG